MVIDPVSPNTLYAGTKNGVYRSTDGGGNWTLINDNLSETYITSLGINSGQYLYAGSNSTGMYRWTLNVGVEERVTNISPANTEIHIQSNPTSGITCINYRISEDTRVNLSVYDGQGRHIKTLISIRQNPGRHEIKWHNTDNFQHKVANGVYFLRFAIDNGVIMKKFILMK